MRPEYVNHGPFPANAGNTRARILKQEPCTKHEAEELNGRLWDYIATMLLRLSTEGFPAPYPKALDDFFDPKIQTFKFSKGFIPDRTNIVVRREGTEVLVSRGRQLGYVAMLLTVYIVRAVSMGRRWVGSTCRECDVVEDVKDWPRCRLEFVLGDLGRDHNGAN
jgi:hypothetical protein